MRPKNAEYRLRAFLIVFGVCAVCFLPIMLMNGGRFFYYGDYNKQQIVFYTHLHDALRDGSFGSFDLFADLGSDTVSSFSFYLLGSPFFWLTLPLPSALVVSVMPLLTAVRSGLAAVGAYCFARRFVRDKNCALIAGILYGLSSFNSANIIFNHFHDAVLILPFMLIALEDLMNDRRRGFFALTAALGALFNYYFFFGQVIFVSLYFAAACISGRFRLTPRRFGRLCFESIAGVMAAAVLLLPSAVSVLQNPRISEHLSGLGLLIYDTPSVYLFILKNLLLLPDITLLLNFGMTTSQSSGSFACYTAFFSLCGAVAYFRCTKGRDTLKLLLIACPVIMFIPVLNQSFSLFNSVFYGRWFYMPLLTVAVATAKACEGGRETLRRGFVPTAALTGAAAAATVIIALASGSSLGFQNRSFVYIQALVPLLGLALLGALLYGKAAGEGCVKALLGRTVAFSAAGMMITVGCSFVFRGLSEESVMNSVFDYAGSGDRLDSGFFRVSSDANYQNLPIIAGYPTVRYFGSTVEPSVISFYEGLGMQRVVKSDPDQTDHPLLTLLSVKYFLDGAYFGGDGSPLPAAESLSGTNGTFRLLYQKNDINFYENTEALPMGFAYDRYTTAEALKDLPPYTRELAYLEALVLTPEQAERYSDILEKYDTSALSDAGERYREICAQRRSMSCTSFKSGGSSFEAEISLEKPALVFFSVPWAEGWSAEVNGSEAPVEKVDGGLMAVRCEAGENTVCFRYKNKWLSAGAFISAGAVLLLIGYVLAGRVRSGKEKNNSPEGE